MEVHENANKVNVYEFRKKKATIVMVAFFEIYNTHIMLLCFYSLYKDEHEQQPYQPYQELQHLFPNG